MELGPSDKNPIPDFKWKLTKMTFSVEYRSAVNPDQVRGLPAAAEAQKPCDSLLMPFFATLYFEAYGSKKQAACEKTH